MAIKSFVEFIQHQMLNFSEIESGKISEQEQKSECVCEENFSNPCICEIGIRGKKHTTEEAIIIKIIANVFFMSKITHSLAHTHTHTHTGHTLILLIF